MWLLSVGVCLMKWKLFNIGMLVFGVFVSPMLLQPEMAAKPPLTWTHLAIISAAIFIGTILIIGMQLGNKRTAKIWVYPSLDVNPFDTKYPLNSMYISGLFILVSGIFAMIQLPWSSARTQDVMVYPLFGFGTFLAVYVSTKLFKFKMSVERA